MNDTPKPEESPAPAQAPQPGGEFRVDTDQRVALTSSIDITFHSHTHKISEGDVESPLGISIIVHEGGREESWDGWVELSGDRIFSVAGVDLELVDYDYGKWMRLRVKPVPAE